MLTFQLKPSSTAFRAPKRPLSFRLLKSISLDGDARDWIFSDLTVNCWTIFRQFSANYTAKLCHTELSTPLNRDCLKKRLDLNFLYQ